MNLQKTLTAQQAEDLLYIATKAAPKPAEGQDAPAVDPLAYLDARIDDLLANFNAQRIQDRAEENQALFMGALSLPEADREEIKALIRTKLGQ